MSLTSNATAKNKRFLPTLQDVMNSPVGVGLALSLARWLPPASGRRFAGWLAGRLAQRRSSSIVQAVRANQAVVHGRHLSPQELDQAVLACFRHTARCLYDFYHNLGDDQALEEMVIYGSEMEALLERIRAGREGAVLAVPHLSNYDLVGRVIIKEKLPLQVLTITQPPAGYRLQNRMRLNAGIEITPVSPAALKQAAQRLREGGVVLTGFDRPVPGMHHPLSFFGRPALLPVGHVRLARRENVPVIVCGVRMQPDGKYRILVSAPIEMSACAGRDEEIVYNAEKVLRVAEAYIRETPEQWAMFFPVWPEGAVSTGGNQHVEN